MVKFFVECAIPTLNLPREVKKKDLFSGENDKIDGLAKRISGSLLYNLLA